MKCTAKPLARQSAAVVMWRAAVLFLAFGVLAASFVPTPAASAMVPPKIADIVDDDESDETENVPQLGTDQPATIKFVDNGRGLLILGQIGAGTADAFHAALAKASPATTEKKGAPRSSIDTVYLASPGGLVGDAIDIAKTLRRLRIRTIAISNCESACSLILAGGVARFAMPYAPVGLHRARSISKNLFSDQMSETINGDMRTAYRSLGVSETLSDIIIGTPSTDMRYPTIAELVAGGLLTAPSNAHHDQAVARIFGPQSDVQARLDAYPVFQRAKVANPRLYAAALDALWTGYLMGLTSTQQDERLWSAVANLPGVEADKLPDATRAQAIRLMIMRLERTMKQAPQKCLSSLLGVDSDPRLLMPKRERDATISLLRNVLDNNKGKRTEPTAYERTEMEGRLTDDLIALRSNRMSTIGRSDRVVRATGEKKGQSQYVACGDLMDWLDVGMRLRGRDEAIFTLVHFE